MFKKLLVCKNKKLNANILKLLFVYTCKSHFRSKLDLKFRLKSILTLWPWGVNYLCLDWCFLTFRSFCNSFDCLMLVMDGDNNYGDNAWLIFLSNCYTREKQFVFVFYQRGFFSLIVIKYCIVLKQISIFTVYCIVDYANNIPWTLFLLACCMHF